MAQFSKAKQTFVDKFAAAYRPGVKGREYTYIFINWSFFKILRLIKVWDGEKFKVYCNFQWIFCRRRTWTLSSVWRTARWGAAIPSRATSSSTRGWTKSSAYTSPTPPNPKPKKIKNIDKCSLINFNSFHVFHSVSTAIASGRDRVMQSNCTLRFCWFIGFGGSSY